MTETFQSKLAKLLQFHSIIQKPEDLNPKNQKELIMAFQSKFSLSNNGELNPPTLWALQESYIQEAEQFQLVDISIDNWVKTKGLVKVQFREDASLRFSDLLHEVRQKGGLVTCSAGIRPIKMVASAGQSPTSMHYPGLAFDLNIYAGFFKPEEDLYVITKVATPHKTDANRYRWNVYCRSEQGQEMELEAYYWEKEQSCVDKTKKIIGKFIDFTAIALKHGFHPIRPLSCFTRPQNRMYICCEWWHFQANDLLIPKLSLFGIELLKIEDYTDELLKTTNPNIWNAKEFIYQVNWW